MNKIKFTLLQISSRNSFSLQSTILIIKMVRYQCQICRKYFTTHGGLIQHASAKHHGHHRRIVLRPDNPVQQRSQPSIPEYDEVLWSTPITMAGPSTSRASASQTSFSQMDETWFTLQKVNHIIICEKKYVHQKI